jgi:hypothetical protein
MSFNFPDNKTLKQGVLQNFAIRNGKVSFDDINILKPADKYPNGDLHIAC